MGYARILCQYSPSYHKQSSWGVLIISATFVRLVMVLTSSHAIQLHWAIFWRATPFSMCATSSNQVFKLQKALLKYTSLFKHLWVLLKNLTANDWLQPMDKVLQHFVINNTKYLILKIFCCVYIPSDRTFLQTYS